MRSLEAWDSCQVGQDCPKLLQMSMTLLNLDDRAFHRELNLSRTIADLTGPEDIEVYHFA